MTIKGYPITVTFVISYNVIIYDILCPDFKTSLLDSVTLVIANLGWVDLHVHVPLYP